MKKLEVKMMEVLEGGVSKEEYCATLWMIITNNPVTAPMLNAWEAHCQD